MEIHTLNLTTRKRKGTHPFTGEVVYSHVDFPLTEKEAEDLRAYLVFLGGTHVGQDGYRYVPTKDGSFINIQDFGLNPQNRNSAFAIEHGEFTQNVAEFLYRMLDISNTVLRIGTDHVAYPQKTCLSLL